MPRIFSLILGVALVSPVFAAANTDMNSAKWICTTNASSSDVDADKAADDQMAKTAGSAASAYSFAAQNCRDCTKITCDVQS